MNWKMLLKEYLVELVPIALTLHLMNWIKSLFDLMWFHGSDWLVFVLVLMLVKELLSKLGITKWISKLL